MDISFATYQLWNLGYRIYRAPGRGNRRVVNPDGTAQVLNLAQFRTLCRQALA